MGMPRDDDHDREIGLDGLRGVVLAARLVPGSGAPTNATVSSVPPTDPLAESIASPSCEPTSSGATTTGSAIATRVTLTSVPCTVNAQMGAVAGPREVWIGPDVSSAAVTRRSVQSEQGSAVVDPIATMASCAESRGTLVARAVLPAHLAVRRRLLGQRTGGRDHPGHERALVVVADGLLPVADLAGQLTDRGDRRVLTRGGHRIRPPGEHRLRPLMGRGRVGGLGRGGRRADAHEGRGARAERGRR